MCDPEDGNEDRHDVPERAHAKAWDVVSHAADERVHEVREADDVREPDERDRESESGAKRER